MKTKPLLTAALLLAGAMALSAQVPGLLNYQGKVSIAATPFTGTGQFKFALVNADGSTTFWSNDSSSTAGAQPTAAVSLPVVNGLYFVQLGDASLPGMTNLSHTVFQNADVRLRVWFNDGVHGFEQITPDQRIAAVGYAMMAGTVQDGAITNNKIAAGAVGATQIAAGAIGSSQMSAGAVQATHIANGAVGSSQLADFAVSGNKMNFGMEEGNAARGTMTSGAGTLTLTQSFRLPFTSPPSVTFSTAGWSLGNVTATGFTATMPFAPVIADGVGNVGIEGSLAIVNGRPAISYYDAPNGDLNYVRANDDAGQSWGTPVTVDGGADIVGVSSSLTVVNGNPAITYYDADGKNLKYVRANDVNGATWGTQRVLDSAGDVGQHTSLVVVNGRPAVCYYDDAPNGNLKYVRASDADGTAWGTPVVVDSTGDVGEYASMVIVAGNPAIAYFDATALDLKFVRSNDANGTAGQWGAPVVIDGADNVGLHASLAVVDGRPAISYFDSSNADLKYARAANATGSSWNAPVTVDSTNFVGTDTCLAVINGTPAISYYDSTNLDLRLVRSLDSQGGEWGTPFVVDASGNVGQDTALVPLNGGAAISYYSPTNLDLKFALVPDLNWRASDGSKVLLTAAAVADGAVGSAQLAAGAVQSANIANGAVQSANIANGAVQSVNIASGAVGNAQIADYSISSQKIQFGAEAGAFTDGTLAVSASTLTFTYNFDYPFASPPAVTLLSPAWALGTVTATNFSASTPFLPESVETTGSVGSHSSLAMVNGLPAIAFYDTTNTRLKYARATDASGSAWGPSVIVDMSGPVGEFPNLLVINGLPAISYYDAGNGKLKYVRASDAEGTSWGSPVIADNSAGLSVGKYNSLAVINGMPAISYYDQTGANLRYVRATNASGTTWSAPVAVQVTGDVGSFTSLVEVGGRPAISYRDTTNTDLKYVRASDANGLTWGTPVNLDPIAEVDGPTSIAMVDGRPAIAYYDISGGFLKYVSAADATGAVWNAPQAIDQATDTGWGASLCVSGGLPVVSSLDFTRGKLKLIIARSASGDQWNNPVSLASNALGARTSIAALPGGVGISYWDGIAGDLKFAFIPELRWQASDGTVTAMVASGVSAGSIGSAQLAAGAVQNSNIALGAVGTANIAAGAVGTTQIAAGAVTPAQLATGAVDYNALAIHYQAGSVDEHQLTFDFNQAYFTVNFPTPFTRSFVVTLGIKGGDDFFTSGVTAKVLGSSTREGFEGRVAAFLTDQQRLDVDNDCVSMAKINGFPAICYYSKQSKRLVYNRATDSRATQWEPFPVRFGNNNIAVSGIWLAEIDGNPAVCYFEVDTKIIKYVRALDPNGTAWGTVRNIAPIVYADLTRKDFSFAEVNGLPALAHYDPIGGNLHYYQFNATSGALLVHYASPDNASNDVGSAVSLAVVAGFPALCYNQNNGGLKYVRALDADGSAWGAPRIASIFGSSESVLAVVDGKPVIALARNSFLQYVKASDPIGAEDWVAARTLNLDNQGHNQDDEIESLSLAVIAGNPAICYAYKSGQSSGLKYLRSKDSAGIHWRSIGVILEKQARTPSLLDVVGDPLVSHIYKEQTNEASLEISDCVGIARPQKPGGGFTINWIAIELP